ncbi:MAG: hemolysin family protein [Chloroflexi bacterium]|nr:hemolysin family protein [Chloroflexota bacterium]
MGLAWVLLAVFLILDLFLAILRVALVNVRIPQLIEEVDQEHVNIETTMGFLEKPGLRTAIRFLIGLMHVLIVACAWFQITYFYPSISLGGLIAVFSFLFVLLIVLEFTVERFPLKKPEKWILRLIPIAMVFEILIRPISATLLFLQGSNLKEQKKLGSVTEDELKTWVEVGQAEGGLELGERKMIYSIFQFGDTLCREIMVPRTEVLALEIKTPLNQAINALIDSGHSRVPVYDDNIDNVVGLLYAKDLLKTQGNSNERISIKKFLRPAYFIPESKKVDELLGEMQAKGIHIAVVVDEYGGMAGLVTLEDIVEEIVGEIRDEYDQGEELLVQHLSPDEVLFRARVSLDDFNDALGTKLVTDQTDTLGGYFYGELGRVPVEGDYLDLEEWRLTVEEVRGRRIGKIRARRDPSY